MYLFKITKPKFRFYRVTFNVLFLSFALNASAQVEIETAGTSEPALNSKEQQQKPYVIVICGDGFRYDYAAKYNAENLLKLSATGVQAESMLPSYPSVTHPNHFTLLTGLYPGHTGIVGNGFYDPRRKAFFKSSDGSWFMEEPIWATAERQHMLTANFHWVDADINFRGIRTNYKAGAAQRGTAHPEPGANFVQQLLQMPEEKRPHLIIMYYYDTDHAGHMHGPDAEETRKAVTNIDDAVGKISEVARASGLPVNFIFVSDHGMANIDQAHPITVPAVIDTSKFVINNQNPLVNVYAKDPADIMGTYEQLRAEHSSAYDVYLNKDVPAEFHYGGKDDRYNRAGDIVLIARFPKTFNPKPGPGAHGYNPYTVKEMGATFLAWGPAFKNNLKLKPFKNTEVYDLITSILKIKGNRNDGEGSLAKTILK